MADPTTWSSPAPGIFRADIGPVPDDIDALTPRSVAGGTPRRDALAALGTAAFPFDQGLVTVETVGYRTILRLPLGRDERLSGFGLQFHRVEHRGRVRVLRVNSDPKEDTGETHAPVPFWVSSSGYGVLIDSARIVTVHAGSCVRADATDPPPVLDRGGEGPWEATPRSDTIEVVVEGGFAVIVFAGPTPLDAVRRYNLWSGGGALPPRWALGFWHRCNLRHDTGQVLALAREYRQRALPCDVIGLEPGWHSACYPCTFTWHPERFPDPDRAIADLACLGFRVNLWEHAYVAPGSALATAIGAGGAGSHTVWGGLVPDLAQASVRAAWGEAHQREHLARGVSGYKIDECDGSELTGCSWMFPGHATFSSGCDGEQMRQIYGVALQRLTADLFQAAGRRTWGLVRASGAGAAPLPFVLYTDLTDIRAYLRAMINAGSSGLLFAPEAVQCASGEELVRRLQIACFSPLMQLNAWASDKGLWDYAGVEAEVRASLELRMRLMPYLYAAFARYREDGTPPVRGLGFEGVRRDEQAGPADLNVDPYGAAAVDGVDDAWLLGDSLLVAPFLPGSSERTIRLPRGDWYDFDSGARFAGGAEHRLAGDLAKIPVFVRDGGIVALMPVRQHAPGPGEAVELEVRHYGRRGGSLRLWDDDGETDAPGRWRTLRVDVAGDGSRNGTFTPAEGASSYGTATFTFLG